MKVRESGMPSHDVWKTFFSPDCVLRDMKLSTRLLNVADIGCGYGTFALPAAARIRGTVHGFDIDKKMICAARRAARHAGLANTGFRTRDIISRGTGLPHGCVNYVMLFNILHAEDPAGLLREARRILAPRGLVGAMHWNPDQDTPRGPSMDIRPKPADCRRWIREAGFRIVKAHVDLPPYHFGVVAKKGRR